MKNTIARVLASVFAFFAVSLFSAQKGETSAQKSKPAGCACVNCAECCGTQCDCAMSCCSN